MVFTRLYLNERLKFNITHFITLLICMNSGEIKVYSLAIGKEAKNVALLVDQDPLQTQSFFANLPR